MFKILDEVCTPKRGTKYSAAIDLYAREDVVIGAGETKVIPLGVCIDLVGLIAKNRYANLDLKSVPTSLDDDIFLSSHYLQLEARSSLRAKGLQAGTGVIDMDFKQEIQLILSNPVGNHFAYMSENSIFSTNKYKISKGDKIAQIMLKEHKTYLMGISTEDKRVGGFGSTGK